MGRGFESSLARQFEFGREKQKFPVDKQTVVWLVCAGFMVGVAQSVEHWIVAPVVEGSIPFTHPIYYLWPAFKLNLSSAVFLAGRLDKGRAFSFVTQAGRYVIRPAVRIAERNSATTFFPSRSHR